MIYHCFKFSLIKGAYDKLRGQDMTGITDDAIRWKMSGIL